MGRKEKYEELVFQLGDLARERLARRADAPRGLQRVLKAESALVAARERLEALEREMNDADAAHRDELSTRAQEKKRAVETMGRWKKAVEPVQNQVKDLRRRLSVRRAELRSGHAALRKEEEKQAALGRSGGAPAESSVQSLKRLRLAQMRLHRDVEDLESDIQRCFELQPGQGGGEGVRAFQKLLEIEDREQDGDADFETRMAEIDDDIAAAEETVRGAENFLDQSVFLLGEECFEQRISDPMLAALYPSLDKVRGG